MFGYKEPNLNSILENSEDDDILDKMKISAIKNILTPFQCFFESSRDEETILTTAISVLQGDVTRTILNTVDNLTKLNDKASAFLISKGKYLNNITDRYKEKILNLSDYELNSIIYHKISYNINSTIPHRIIPTSLVSGSRLLEQRPVNKDDIKNLRENIKNDMNNIRVVMLGYPIRIQDYDFETTYKSIFKKEDYSFNTHLTKIDLSLLLSQIQGYEATNSILQRNFKIIMETINVYMNISKTILSNKHQYSVDSIKLKNLSGKTYINDSRAIGFHHEYQSILISFILTLIDMYSSIFKYKLTVINEKASYDQALLKQITDHIDKSVR